MNSENYRIWEALSHLENKYSSPFEAAREGQLAAKDRKP